MVGADRLVDRFLLLELYMQISLFIFILSNIKYFINKNVL